MPENLIKVWVVYFAATGAISAVWYTDPTKEVSGFLQRMSPGYVLQEMMVTSNQLRCLAELQVEGGRLVHNSTHARIA